MLTKRQLRIKRIFDLAVAIVLIPFVLIPILIFAILASISTKQNGIFVQERIGQFGKPFRCYKIRSLKGSQHVGIDAIKSNETPFGRWLRWSKMDELPQLFNVLEGTMSLVGPRPDISGYADELSREDSVLLEIKPGITGPATLKYKNEDAVLLKQKDAKKYNDTVIWPDKIKLNKTYIKNWSLRKDIGYLWASISK